MWQACVSRLHAAVVAAGPFSAGAAAVQHISIVYTASAWQADPSRPSSLASANNPPDQHLSYASGQGVVAFFPSFAAADLAQQAWQASGGLAALQRLKQVVWEPREASQLEAALHTYAAAALQGSPSAGESFY